MSQKQKTTTTVTTTKRKNSRRKNTRRVVQTTPKISHTLNIAPCTRMYAKALVNPFAVQGLPCIPDSIILPSYKLQTKVRGVFSTGTVGGGYVLIDPFQMLVNNGGFVAPANYGGAVYYTDKTYPYNVLEVGDGALSLKTGVQVANPNSMFSLSSLDSYQNQNNRQFRLVGCGLRINYIGSNLYNAGRLIIFRNQGSKSIDASGITTPPTLLQDNYTSITTVSRSHKYVYFVPDDPAFVAYSPFNEYSPQLADTLGNPGTSHHCMGIFVDGGSVAPNQQSWEFEAVAYFEMVGQGLTLSRSEGDPVGHDIVMSSLPNTAPTSAPASVENSVMSNFIRGFTETTREIAYNVGKNSLNIAGAAYNYYNQSTRQRYLQN